MLSSYLSCSYVDKLLLVSVDLFLGLGLEAAVGSSLLLLDHNGGVIAVDLRGHLSTGHNLVISNCLWIEIIQKVYLILSELMRLFLCTYIVTDLGEVRCQN